MPRTPVLLLLLLSAWPAPCLAATTVAAPKPASASSHQVEELLHEARHELMRDRYDEALKLLERYLAGVKPGKVRPVLHFYVVDAIGRIYLTIKQDPDRAVQFFSQLENDDRFTEAEQDIMSGWISGAKEWKNFGKMPKDVHDPSQLFELGTRFYEKGVRRQKFVMDPAGSVDLSIAATYLIPFTVHFDKDPRIGEVLFMMGDIRRRTWYDNEFWSENFYLIEAIRRFPNTPLAQKAYKALEDDVHFGYTGSSGDNTPPSWIELLKDFKLLAEPAKPAANKPATME